MPESKPKQVIKTWADIHQACSRLAARHPDCGMIWGVPNGGSHVAHTVWWIMRKTNPGIVLLDEPRGDCLIVDDLVDSGETMESIDFPGPRDALFHKGNSPESRRYGSLVDGWIIFPWERRWGSSEGPLDAVTRLLEWIGEDPRRDGLRDTPSRVLKALQEMTGGMREEPADILQRTFEIDHDQMIVVKGVRFASLCEHHMLPFIGTAAIGYVPKDDAGKHPRVVGLSKLARLVHCFARRLQVQERMTDQIAKAIQTNLGAAGVGVIIKAHHACMGCRGVREPDAEMVTSRLIGVMEKPEVRAEFMRLAGF